MDVKAVLIKLKPDTDQSVKHWQAQIERLKEEAIESIRNEGITIESWFQAEISGDKYLLAYLRSENLEQAYRITAASKLEVDKVHQQFKRSTWDRHGIVDCELLIDLSS